MCFFRPSPLPSRMENLWRPCRAEWACRVSANTWTVLIAHQRLWLRSPGGSVRQRRWGTRGWRTSWVQSLVAPGGCTDPCGSHGGAVTTGTSESDINTTLLDFFFFFWRKHYARTWIFHLLYNLCQNEKSNSHRVYHLSMIYLDHV